MWNNHLTWNKRKTDLLNSKEVNRGILLHTQMFANTSFAIRSVWTNCANLFAAIRNTVKYYHNIFNVLIYLNYSKYYI